MPDQVAGHWFDSWGRCTRQQTDGSDCPIHWRTIATADTPDVDQPGLAHYGKLSVEELNQIRNKRAAELIAIDRAMASVSGRS